MPRAKKSATKTEKKVVAKKTVKKKNEPKIDLEAIKEELRKEIQEQIQEAILNIEIEVPEPVVQAPAKQTEATLNRSTLTLEGKKRYTFVSDLDGLVISELDKNLLTLSNTGAIGVGTKAPNSNRFNFITAKSDTVEDGKNGLEVFKVDGEGSVHTETGYFSNSTGYAELFEWADGNQKNEERIGLTVTLNAEGKLVVADEGDTVVGVVVENAAVIGDAGWNAWEDKYQLQENQNPKTKKYKIVEWVDDEGILQSYYLSSLSKEFALPEDAIIYETYEDGSDMHLKVFNEVFDIDRPFIPKLKRGWAVVVLVGRVNMWKGQLVEKHWFKISDINDDIEQWILR